MAATGWSLASCTVRSGHPGSSGPGAAPKASSGFVVSSGVGYCWEILGKTHPDPTWDSQGSSCHSHPPPQTITEMLTQRRWPVEWRCLSSTPKPSHLGPLRLALSLLSSLRRVQGPHLHPYKAGGWPHRV